MTQYTVTPEYIAQAAANAHSTATLIEGELATLRSYVEQLGAGWLGVASSTFQAMMTDYNAYARMLHDALDAIGSGLQGNYVNYVNMEQENIAQLVPIAGEIPPLNLEPVPTGPAGPGQITNP
ncbi:WXG100 family type VII secretion target [Micromonospora sp. NPDC023814]|uniref:WXG100 family type VII secretion target n=1 Tax=Micromonospora sp. NPDC023814 TaxID=3154596 RepID=UPI00340B12D4